MNNEYEQNMVKLAQLVSKTSKHSSYQLLHPNLATLIQNTNYRPSGKWEQERQEYMNKHQSMADLRILDIGANTGYFSFAAIDSGAQSLVCQEGNLEHAKFISLASICLGIEDKIEVRPNYYDFLETNSEKECYDLVLCLNVLHHLGDDFGSLSLNLNSAKDEMIGALNRLANNTHYCWMQLGFNWKGNPLHPLFSNGTKNELIDFIRQGIQGNWAIERIAVFDPIKKHYEDASESNLHRFDFLGEFLNRPLFLLRSLKTNNI
jgi:hypothetical protein